LEVKRLRVVTAIAYTALASGCASGDHSVNLDSLKNADAPYYYVGSSFDGHDVSYVARYRAGMARIIYGTCDAGSDEACPPPLEIQQRLCFGVVTISIFVGQGARSGSARRAADALRPLSKGARARTQEPDVVFDRGVAC
jgi:hypothetical protein